MNKLDRIFLLTVGHYLLVVDVYCSLQKIPQFHLISWCGNFVESHIFRIVSGESPKPMRKLFLSTKFSHQEIR